MMHASPRRLLVAVSLSIARAARFAASPCAALLLVVSSLGSATIFAEDQPAPQSPIPPAAVNENPLLTESPLPYHLPPFDKIKDSDFEPAYEQGMAVHLKEIAAIADNTAPLPSIIPSSRWNARDNSSRGSN